jgi:hypothetical protein
MRARVIKRLKNTLKRTFHSNKNNNLIEKMKN